MSDFAISTYLPGTAASDAATPGTGSRDPIKAHDAAQQFEALLMGQILRSARQGGSGWLGSGEDSSAECATDFAEQQFAAVLARQGGLGLATLITSGLSARDGK
uniref:Flagellar protein FlgJ N-terminal domain-containing protein n=1 Tax=Solibacter usitatus (strain Ellin6076) TaxID=234267 RepID=Q01PR3_SOLUE